MKLLVYTLLTVLLLPQFLPAQRLNLEVSRMLSQDEAPVPYVEIYIGIETAGLQRKQGAKGWQCAVELDMTVISLPDSGHLFHEKQVVYSEGVKDTLEIPGLLRLQIRKPLVAGNYGIVLRAQDHWKTRAEWLVQRSFFYIRQPSDSLLSMADITLIHSLETAPQDSKSPFAKYGLHWYPLANGGLLSPEDTLRFLTEVYNTESVLGKYYFVDYFISKEGSPTPLPDYHRRIKSVAPSRHHPISGSIPLAALKEGNYTLHVVIRTHDGSEHIRQFKHFVVQRPLLAQESAQAEDAYNQLYGYSAAELDELLPQLAPISNKLEVEFTRSLKTFAQKKNYFVSFWQKRALQNNTDPQTEAINYLKRLTYANQHYRAGKKPGWTTDRGRILLEHGPPDDVQYVAVEAGQYAHEIWNYNSLRNQRGVMFVFADMDLSGNNYRMIHSNLNGEISNDNWRQNIIRTNQNFAPNYNVTSPRQDNPLNTLRVD
ncbi:MAG: GWxTD domain-containing protein [Bacteroidetes bacterium]|nr:GWxTD domain-containing protein [Bacteroidota bacterium]